MNRRFYRACYYEPFRCSSAFCCGSLNKKQIVNVCIGLGHAWTHRLESACCQFSCWQMQIATATSQRQWSILTKVCEVFDSILSSCT